MNRHIVPALFFAALAAGPALAQSPPESEDNRYQFHKVEDGFIRLDQRTGQVSLCSRRTSGWSCQTVPDERAALEAEIARLQGEGAGLKKALLDRGLPLPGGVKSPPPVPPSARGEGELRSPGQDDLNRMVAAVERVWRRLVEMITTLQKDMMKKT